MKTTFSIVILLLFSVLYAQSFLDYYPLNVGDYWIQHGDEFQGNPDPVYFTQEMEDTDLILGEEFLRRLYEYTYEDGTLITCWYVWMRVTTEGLVIGAIGGTPNIAEANIIDPPVLYFPNEALNFGYTWQFNSPQMGGLFTFENVGVGESVTVPAGTFNNCVRISVVIVDSIGTTTQNTEYYFAENVGEVKNEGWAFYWEDMLLELIEYSVQTSSPQNEIPNTEFHISNYPNPFNPTTTIKFTTEDTEKNTEIIIYNIKGQNVKTLQPFPNPDLSGGTRSVQWDGTDDTGKPVSSGIYLYQLKAGDKSSQTRKMLLVK